MKNKEIKLAILDEVRRLAQNDNNLDKIVRNVSTILNRILKNDDEDFNVRYLDDVVTKFQSYLQKEIPNTKHFPVPKDMVDPLLKKLSEVGKSLKSEGKKEKTEVEASEGEVKLTKQQLLVKSTKEKVASLPPRDVKKGSQYATEPVYYSQTEQDTQQKNPNCVIEVVTDMDSQNTALDHTTRGLNPLVMNAANGYHIGGHFEFGTGTQEESLFFTTDLYTFLYELGTPQNDGRYFYTASTSLAHKTSDNPNAYYNPNIRCFRIAASNSDTGRHNYQDCPVFEFGVFTIHGFDLRGTSNSDHSDRSLFETGYIFKDFHWDKFSTEMQKKYELFFETALAHGHRSVVAAPLSCGAFKHANFPNETYEAVAIAYAAALEKYAPYFERVSVVAIDPKLQPMFNKHVDLVKKKLAQSQQASTSTKESKQEESPRSETHAAKISEPHKPLHHETLFVEKNTIETLRTKVRNDESAKVFPKEGLTKLTSRYIYFMLNPAELDKTNASKEIGKLCPEYKVEASVLGLEIMLPLEKFANFATILQSSGIKFGGGAYNNKLYIFISPENISQFYRAMFHQDSIDNYTDAVANAIKSRTNADVRVVSGSFQSTYKHLNKLREDGSLMAFFKRGLMNENFLDKENQYYVDKFLLENIVLWQNGKLNEKTYDATKKIFPEAMLSSKKIELPDFSAVEKFCATHFQKLSLADTVSSSMRRLIS